MRNIYSVLLTAILALTVSDAALAYVGPGAGLSLLGALWGLLLAVGAALAFVIFWPLRQMRKRAQARRAEAAAESQGSPTIQQAEAAQHSPAPQSAASQDSGELQQRAP